MPDAILIFPILLGLAGMVLTHRHEPDPHDEALAALRRIYEATLIGQRQEAS